MTSRHVTRPLVRLARQAGIDAGYLLVGLPLGVATFTIAVTGLSLAAGLAITLIGIPVLVATLFAMRGIAHLERRRAGALLGERVTDVERSWRGRPWQTTKAATTDPAAWRDAAWSLLLLPVGTAGFTVAVTLWSTALGFVTSPLWYWALPDDDPDLAFLNDPSAPWAALRVLAGLVLIPVAYLVCRGLATGTARLGWASWAAPTAGRSCGCPPSRRPRRTRARMRSAPAGRTRRARSFNVLCGRDSDARPGVSVASGRPAPAPRPG